MRTHGHRSAFAVACISRPYDSAPRAPVTHSYLIALEYQLVRPDARGSGDSVLSPQPLDRFPES